MPLGERNPFPATSHGQEAGGRKHQKSVGEGAEFKKLVQLELREARIDSKNRSAFVLHFSILGKEG